MPLWAKNKLILKETPKGKILIPANKEESVELGHLLGKNLLKANKAYMDNDNWFGYISGQYFYYRTKSYRLFDLCKPYLMDAINLKNPKISI